MRENSGRKSRPEALDRLMELMRYFHCAEPRELEYVLGLEADTLVAVFRSRLACLPEKVVSALRAAGVRKDFLLNGEGSLFEESFDGSDLGLMERQTAMLLQRLCHLRSLRAEGGRDRSRTPLQVADGSTDPVTIDEELISLLIDALRDKNSRERLLNFIRTDAANRNRSSG